MRPERVEIAELVLRLPGVGRAEAPALADAILRKVQDNLRGTGRVGRLHLVELRLQVPAGLGKDALVDHVADRITEVIA